ncbi:MAG: VOC family protein [Anaerolineae bacterium]|nr:VOC family protein [Anaerolineae bacterium]
MGRKIVHLEIFADDRVKTAQFYADLFGWEVQDYADMNYTMLNLDSGEPGIGIGQPSEQNPGYTAFYIDSADLEADLAAIRARGGEVVVEPMQVPGVGSMAFFKDPAGNLVALGKFEQM